MQFIESFHELGNKKRIVFSPPRHSLFFFSFTALAIFQINCMCLLFPFSCHDVSKLPQKVISLLVIHSLLRFLFLSFHFCCCSPLNKVALYLFIGHYNSPVFVSPSIQYVGPEALCFAVVRLCVHMQYSSTTCMQLSVRACVRTEAFLTGLACCRLPVVFSTIVVCPYLVFGRYQYAQFLRLILMFTVRLGQSCISGSCRYLFVCLYHFLQFEVVL